MKASIVVPTLNEEKALRGMLESVRGQRTSHDIEIIVVDSYSTDETLSIAKELADKILTEPPGIIARARQKGSMEADGDAIVSVCADTIYDKNWLEELLMPVEKGYVATAGKVLAYDGNFIENAYLEYVHAPATSFFVSIGFPLVAGESMAFTKEAFKKVNGYRTDLVTGEDTNLIKRLAKIGKITYCPKSIARLSTRRARKWGYLRYFWFHTTNFLKTNLFHKSHDRYEPVR